MKVVNAQSLPYSTQVTVWAVVDLPVKHFHLRPLQDRRREKKVNTAIVLCNNIDFCYTNLLSSKSLQILQ